MGNILVPCFRLTRRTGRKKTTSQSAGSSSTTPPDRRNRGSVNRATVIYPADFNHSKRRCSTLSVSQRFPADNTRRRSSSCSILHPDTRLIVKVDNGVQCIKFLHGHNGQYFHTLTAKTIFSSKGKLGGTLGPRCNV